MDEFQIGKEEKTLDTYVSEIVTAYMKRYDNNVLLVAKKLDIGKSTIYNMINSNKISVATKRKRKSIL